VKQEELVSIIIIAFIIVANMVLSYYFSAEEMLLAKQI